MYVLYTHMNIKMLSYPFFFECVRSFHKAGTLFIVEEASSHFKKEQMANIFYGGWVAWVGW